MTFKKMSKPEFPPRLWALVGYAGDGKSTFATQMRTPLLPIDADHRFREVVHLVQGDVYELSNTPADSINPERIYQILSQNMPGGDVSTIVVDSLTAILTPLVTQAILESDARRERNKNRKPADKENLIAPFKDKALAMRLLQDAVTRWGVDVLWIYHLQDSRDQNANEVTRPILSATERARLYRSINLEIHIVKEKEKRGIKVVWARRGRSGMTLWDESGVWAGMPEKIEAAVYGGLSQEQQEQIEQRTPAVFANDEAAVEWGMNQGVFQAIQHARNAYNKIQREYPEVDEVELSQLWITDVQQRQSPPSFKSLDDLLYQLKLDFDLNEADAKAKLRELGFTGFPKNGDAAKKSSEMYLAVKAAMDTEE